jgi:hypothetical protein
MMPEMVNKSYNKGPADVFVRSKDDLTIIGAVDLEWVYAGLSGLWI